MKKTYYCECKSYETSESLLETLHDWGVMDTGIHKSKYNCSDVSWSLKIKVKGGNIAIFYIMVAYKLKVANVEDDTLNLSSIIQNNNVCPSKRQQLW